MRLSFHLSRPPEGDPRPARSILLCALLLALALITTVFTTHPPIAAAAPRDLSPCPDYDGDGLVTPADVQAVVVRWRLTAANPDPDGDPTTPNYEARFDLDGNGIVTVLDVMLAAVQLGQTCPCAPAIAFTHVPAYGSTEDLQGQVNCAEPADYRVAVYIYVDGWWNKPTWAEPLTTIRPDGSWTCDVTTGGGDPWATRLAAFLLPASYAPPLLDGDPVLPADLWDHAAAQAIVSRGPGPRQIEFAGHLWTVKASETPVGPGPNYFSDRPEDVWVDAAGRLHLRIVQRDGRWYCTEVVTGRPFGYGNYVFRVAPLARELNPNAVVGLFTWDNAAAQYNFRELDVEFSRWGDPANDNAQYVVQPWDHPGNVFRFNLDLLAESTTHCFDWHADRVTFQSVWGDVACLDLQTLIQTLRVSQNPKGLANPIASWTYTGPDVPPAGDGQARINLWLMSGHPPTDGQPIEVVVEGFEFTLAPVTSSVAAPAVLHTQIFQQGLNGYTGGRDTWVSTLDWDTPPQYTVNYGQNMGLELSRNDGDNPLLRFDLSSIPPNSAVLTATLALYNTTPSSFSGTQDFARRIKLYRVLRDWDEGNQVASPIDAPGDHGATGDYAFAYYPGEGTNDPWTARGMAAGTDYVEAPESYADVVNEGWYDWDATALVTAWVRGEAPNYGLVLHDATGYQDDHCDWRTFASAQESADPALRPKLTVVYNPDTPYADAGPDQVNLSWDGGPLTLDGSASHDRPGGDDASLVYAWRVIEAAYGSILTDTSISNTQYPITTFTPDAPGEWEIELTVTNNLGERATDRVHLRLLKIPAGHPRLYLTPERLATLRARALPSNPRWAQLQAEADDPEGEMHARALVGVITGQVAYCDQAIAAALTLVADPYDYSTRTGDIALVYDWCYDRLTAGQRTTFVSYFNAWGDDVPKDNDSPGWGNYWPRWGYSYALVGLATYGDNPRAIEWLDEFRYRRYRDTDLPLLERIAAGGGWPEGTVYDWIANWPRVKTLDAWLTAAGEDLFASTSWYRERLGYLLLQHWPGYAEQWGEPYHPYPSIGDAERNRGSMSNYSRIMGLILIDHFSDEPLARQLQAYLATPPVDNSMSFLYHEEFIWFDMETGATGIEALAGLVDDARNRLKPLVRNSRKPVSEQGAPPGPAAIEAPSLLTHYAAGTGTLFVRSGWPAGAADTDASATYLTFQAGDHFTYHQHYDQNSFTLFKRGDPSTSSGQGLAVESGVYSGDGRSDHDINYYARTIAHNTLIVYNPAEDFQHARPDAYANDGGQRTMSPASRSPGSIEYFDQHITQYDTADLLRFEDTPAYTYALGDATKAYNNPTYNQAMDGYLTGNVAKVSRFQREFVYLRPAAGAGLPWPVGQDRLTVSLLARSETGQSADAGDYLVLFDRVGVTQPSFSGANTKLLFHVLNEPMVNGTPTAVSPGETLYTGADEATAVSGDGKLFIKVLLPAARNVRKVGGRGIKAFWVFDRNYDWHWDPAEPQPRPVNDFEDVPYGEWRLELEPADVALEHNFLTVLYPAISTTVTMPVTTLITGTGLAGAHIADPDLNRVALFSSAPDGSAPAGTLVYSYTPTTRTLNVLFDLPPGARYTVSATLAGGIQEVTLTRGLFMPPPAPRGIKPPTCQALRKYLARGESFSEEQGVLRLSLSRGAGEPGNAIDVQVSAQGVLSFIVKANGVPCSLVGDFDGDGVVTEADLHMAAAQWRQPVVPANVRFDLDGDGDIDALDLLLAAVHLGETCLLS